MALVWLKRQDCDDVVQVNMPADSFESPLTLAACGGHVELANLLIERGANLEEVNDEGYTPLMEAAREGHEEMVALLLAHGMCVMLSVMLCCGIDSGVSYRCHCSNNNTSAVC